MEWGISGVKFYDLSLLEPNTGRFQRALDMADFCKSAFQQCWSGGNRVTNKLFKANNYSFGGKNTIPLSSPSTERHLKNSSSA